VHPLFQKLLAVLGGLLVIAIALFWAFFASADVARTLGHKMGLASEFAEGDAIYKKFGDFYTTLSVLGLAITAGFAFTLLAWERRPKRWRIEFTFWILLALSLPMSIINFWSGDIFVSRSQQVFLNLVQVFLTGVCALQLSRRQTSSDAETVLKSMTMLFLLAFGVFIPLMFTALWSLHALKIISDEASEALSSGWVSAISGIAALGVSIFQYRLAKSKQTGDSKNAGSKILLR